MALCVPGFADVTGLAAAGDDTASLSSSIHGADAQSAEYSPSSAAQQDSLNRAAASTQSEGHLAQQNLPGPAAASEDTADYIPPAINNRQGEPVLGAHE